MSLLPSRDPASPDADPRVIPVDSDDADEVLSALSAETARKLLAELHEEPAPPGELADRVDTSLQNAQYHLDKLEAAGAVAVVDTAYSEKGREMDVYAPADQPLVICAGDEQDTSGVRSALTSLLGGVGVLAVLSVVVQQALGEGIASLLGPDVRSGSAGGSGPSTSYAADPSSPYSQSTDVATAAVADGGSTAQSAGEAAVAGGLPPGLLFFAGGAVVLAALFALWYADQ
ncbi:ArsR/SmtB family transcription factor [Halomicrobium urmianum]|uniref:ArsR/SmtB family transcription factor n=1 Tax=Halomicrobium urmianum TaxID=1586233 RepID=UPI001CD943BA|nr:helix-turn-helix domain-containing protein [Halomicrobium urmianum]